MKDKVVIYDDTYDPAVTGAIAAATTVDMATLNAGPYGFVIEEAWVWSPYTALGAPADLDDIEILIDGQPVPSSPGRLRIRAMANRSMAVPYDQRFAQGPFPFGKVSLDPLEDTTIKVTPAQQLSVRLHAGTVGGVLATDSPIRVMLAGRIAETDGDIQDIYGGTLYQPGGPIMIGDAVTGAISPIIQKQFPISIDNMKMMSGATGQSAPKIGPFWAWGVNSAVIPSTPEYEWTFRNPAHLARSEMEMSFDWTRITNRALWIKDLAAYIAVGRGRVFWHQPPFRRPGHKNLFFGWAVNSAFPNLLPGGGAPAVAGATWFKGPYGMDPKILAFNNLTELRVIADAGTTILAGNLEMQLRGTHIEF